MWLEKCRAAIVMPPVRKVHMLIVMCIVHDCKSRHLVSLMSLLLLAFTPSHLLHVISLSKLPKYKLLNGSSSIHSSWIWRQVDGHHVYQLWSWRQHDVRRHLLSRRKACCILDLLWYKGKVLQRLCCCYEMLCLIEWWFVVLGLIWKDMKMRRAEDSLFICITMTSSSASDATRT